MRQPSVVRRMPCERAKPADGARVSVMDANRAGTVPTEARVVNIIPV
jgi:hypothetical protein